MNLQLHIPDSAARAIRLPEKRKDKEKDHAWRIC